jgi:dipeptidyl aminopeptidase/acylaminoacyl peptidase
LHDPSAPSARRRIDGVAPLRVAMSPDAQLVAASTDGGITLVTLDGSAPLRRLTTDPSDDWPAFRAVGRDVLFKRTAPDGRPRVMSVPIAGGEPVPVGEPGSSHPAAAPAGDAFAYLAGDSPNSATPALWLSEATHRVLSPSLGPGTYSRPSFSPDGRRVAVVRGGREVVEVDVASGKVLRAIGAGSGESLRAPAYVPEGLVVLRSRWRGNVWLADVDL